MNKLWKKKLIQKNKNDNGAVIVEACISLSVFMFMIVMILSITNLCIAQTKIGIALNETAKETSMSILNAKEVEEILSRYVDLSEFPDFHIGEFANNPNTCGCFVVGKSWYIYETDEKNNSVLTGPIRTKGIIEACMGMLHFSCDEKDRERLERKNTIK